MSSIRLRTTGGAVTLVALVLLHAEFAAAQLFGERNLGGPVAPHSRLDQPVSISGGEPYVVSGFGIPTAPSTGMEQVGTVSGAERFIRGNRSAAELVGASITQQGTFVGIQQATPTAPVTSSVAGLTAPPRPRVNRIPPAVSSSRPRPYAPRLELAFAAPTVAGDTQRTATVAQRLSRLLGPRAKTRLELSWEGSTAILRGEVADAYSRSLAARLVALEPGFGSLRNELRVSAPARP